MSDPWYLGHYLALDTETTGVDVEQDRVVTACTALVDGSGKSRPRVREWLAWPGIDIPAGAQKVHGVTTEHAHTHGLPAVQVAAEACEEIIGAVKDGIPLVLFNAPFDLTLLDRETRRHDLEPLAEAMDGAGGVRVIDAYVIDKALSYRKGPRNLGATCEHYGVALEGAHTASGDALAAARVAWKLAQKYPRIAGMGLGALHEWQAAEKLKQARSYDKYLRDKGDHAKADEIDGWWPLRPYGEDSRWPS